MDLLWTYEHCLQSSQFSGQKHEAKILFNSKTRFLDLLQEQVDSLSDSYFQFALSLHHLHSSWMGGCIDFKQLVRVLSHRSAVIIFLTFPIPQFPRRLSVNSNLMIVPYKQFMRPTPNLATLRSQNTQYTQD